MFQRQADLADPGIQEAGRAIEVVGDLFRASQRHNLAHPERLEAAESVEVVLVAEALRDHGHQLSTRGHLPVAVLQIHAIAGH
ncbi:hypothetical protein [Streptomyces sp. NPDC127033]|uniref:hypothetical protein n=1 Tax=Streptomyces sp. NPDC127033 TaxID=3347110 RepID=UPI003660E7FB